MKRHSGMFKPGQSGNPNGRPKRAAEHSFLQGITTQLTPAKWEKIVKKAIAQAGSGDAVARAWLGNYMMGKPIERIQEEMGWTPEQMAAALDGEDEAGE